MVPDLPSDQNAGPQSLCTRLHPESITHEKAQSPAATEAESRAREPHSDITQDPIAKHEANELSTHQQTRTVPDFTLGSFCKLEPPPLSSQPSPTALPQFPRSPLENLLTKLRDEAERKTNSTGEELSAEEKEEKEKLEEQRRVKREKENEIWSSCHLFVGGSGIARRPGPVEVVEGVKGCGEWEETKTEQKSAVPKVNIGNGCTAVNGFHLLLPTPFPQEEVRENRKILAKTPQNPCDRKDNFPTSTSSGRNKIRKIEFVDSEEDEEIEREIELAFAPSKPDSVRAPSSQISYERRKQSRDIDGETLSAITLAESHPLDVIAPSGGVDQEKERLSRRRLINYVEQTDAGHSTTVKKKKYVFEAETDDEDEDEVDGETREDRLQEFIRAMGSSTGGCSCCSVKPPSKNPDIDNIIKRNRARLDSIH